MARNAPKIITANYFTAGIDSLGMRQLRNEFSDLSEQETHARDTFADILTPERYAAQFRHITRTDLTGTRYEGDPDGGEIDLFEDLTE